MTERLSSATVASVSHNHPARLDTTPEAPKMTHDLDVPAGEPDDENVDGYVRPYHRHASDGSEHAHPRGDQPHHHFDETPDAGASSSKHDDPGGMSDG